MTFRPDKWTICTIDGYEYEAIGEERRGAYWVPVADIVDGQYIQCDVYEIVHGMVDDEGDIYISIAYPNAAELRLLAEARWQYDGYAYAHKMA